MVSEADEATAVQPDVVAAARALLARLRHLQALQAAPFPWDMRELHVDDRTALMHAASSPSEAQAALAAHIAALKKQMAEYKAQFGAQVREAYASSMRDALGHAEAGEDPALNEEGLPFVDPLEMLPDSPPETPQLSASVPRPTSNVLGRAPGQVAPFDPTMKGEERHRWMASILDELEKEENAELNHDHQDVPKFAGLRRGFLQEPKQEPPKKQVRFVESSESSDDEAMDEVEQAPRTFKAPPGMDPEDAGVQEEAARIVDLLGPEVIRGHPNAERIFAEMETAQPRMVQKAVSAPPPSTPAKPAIGETVVERTADAGTRRAPSAGRKVSAFKQRQLDKQRQAHDPENDGPVPPLAPSISQGVSAIERAGRMDDSLSASRVHAGLPPEVPHARPTKAYAAKLQQRATEAASQVLEEPQAETPGRRVRFNVQEVCPMDENEEEPMDNEGENEPPDHVPGDIDDDDEFHQEPDDDDESMPDDTWTSEDEMLWDSDEEYGPEDLEALKPSMDEHPQDSFWTDELAREYAEAKARLAISSASKVALNEASDNQEAYGVCTIDLPQIAPLDASVTEAERPRVSRFKAARLAGESVPDPNGDVAHELHAAQGSTPVMVLPTLAPVRFPRSTDGNERAVDLDGESDEDDERLHALMRARLSMQGSAPEDARVRNARPPEVGRAT